MNILKQRLQREQISKPTESDSDTDTLQVTIYNSIYNDVQ